MTTDEQLYLKELNPEQRSVLAQAATFELIMAQKGDVYNIGIIQENHVAARRAAEMLGWHFTGRNDGCSPRVFNGEEWEDAGDTRLWEVERNGITLSLLLAHRSLNFLPYDYDAACGYLPYSCDRVEEILLDQLEEAMANGVTPGFVTRISQAASERCEIRGTVKALELKERANALRKRCEGVAKK
ncbi:MAG: hypothetical protein HF312_15675 [Ignavibacteria bacterium]|jgi:hypothetical protein|nr:hypothetical protein [Ignavibacteria bacterium]